MTRSEQLSSESAERQDSAVDRETCTLDPNLQTSMARYQKGSFEAFETIYAELAPLLGRYLGARSHPAEVADLLQETFLQIHRSRHTHRPGRPVEPWAIGIARHAWAMSHRRRGRRQREERLAADASSVSPRTPDVQFVDRDRLRRALEKLGPKARWPLILHHLWGLTFKEIGRILGIAPGAARVRSHRARLALRASLDEKGSNGAE